MSPELGLAWWWPGQANLHQLDIDERVRAEPWWSLRLERTVQRRGNVTTM